MTLTLAFVDPRLWVTVHLFQVGSLLSYLPYFRLSVRAPIYALLPVTLVLAFWPSNTNGPTSEAVSASEILSSAAQELS